MDFALSELFTAEGALVGAAAVMVVVQLLKRFVPFLPDGGPQVLWMVGLLSAGLVALAVADAGGVDGAQGILSMVMTWATVATAAIGIYEGGITAGRAVKA